MNAPVFQTHIERQPPAPSPHKLRSRTGRLAAQQLEQQQRRAVSPLPPLPRPPRLFLPAPPPPAPMPMTHSEPARSPPLILQILSHPRLPMLLLAPLAILLAYTLHVLVHGLLHAQHLAHEKPWTALARMLEARAREAQWNSLAAVARVFAPAPAEQPGLAAQVARWMGFV